MGERTDLMRELIAKIGCSQRRAAELLEVDERTFRYWAASNPEPPMMAIYALKHLAFVHAKPDLRPDPVDIAPLI